MSNYKYYYYNAINDSVDIKELLASYGLNGPKVNSFHCPNPAHADKHASASVKDNKCKCFACGIRVGPIDLVMLRDNISSHEAAQKLCDMYGLSDGFYEEKLNNTSNKKNSTQVNEFPLTEEDLKNLGFTNGYGLNVKLPLYEEQVKDIYGRPTNEVRSQYTCFVNHEVVDKKTFKETPNTLTVENNEDLPLGLRIVECNKDVLVEHYAVKNKSIHYNLKSLWQEDRYAFNYLIVERIKTNPPLLDYLYEKCNIPRQNEFDLENKDNSDLELE